MKTYDVSAKQETPEEMKALARLAMGLVHIPEPEPEFVPAPAELGDMATQLEEVEKAYRAQIQGLKMLMGGIRRHLAARDAAGRIAEVENIRNPIGSMINGAPMPGGDHQELRYLEAIAALAVRKVRAGQPLTKEGLTAV